MASHKRLSNWYTQLGQHLEAGILLADALELSEGPPSKDRLAMAERIRDGDTVENVLKQAPRWLPQSDRLFILAAIETGSLPTTLRNLSDRHGRIGATQLKVALGLLYPLGVLHLAALLLPVVGMIDYEAGFLWDPAAYGAQVMVILLPVWLILGSIMLLARSQHPALPRLLSLFPLLRKYVRMQALADLAYSLGTFVAAGVPVPSAWRLSTKIARDPRFFAAANELEPLFASGRDPSEALRQFKCFPPEFVSFYRTGAESGKLDANMILCGRQFQEQANTAMTLAAIVYPSLIFAAVAGFIVFAILQSYAGYLQIFDQF
jgi:general secretion pathway protein F/type IV pilus assembly protein PilC